MDSENLSIGDFLYLKVIQLADLSCNTDKLYECFTMVNPTREGLASKTESNQHSSKNELKFNRKAVDLEIERNKIWE